jgi:hypothetical protein
MERDFFNRERACRPLILEVLKSTEQPLRLGEIFDSVQKLSDEYTTDVIQHAVIALVDQNEANINSDLRIQAGPRRQLS